MKFLAISVLQAVILANFASGISFPGMPPASMLNMGGFTPARMAELQNNVDAYACAVNTTCYMGIEMFKKTWKCYETVTNEDIAPGREYLKKEGYDAKGDIKKMEDVLVIREMACSLSNEVKSEMALKSVELTKSNMNKICSDNPAFCKKAVEGYGCFALIVEENFATGKCTTLARTAEQLAELEKNPAMKFYQLG